MRFGIVYTMINAENKMLLEAARKRNVELEKINEDELILRITDARRQESENYDAILQRSTSFTRTLYSTKYFEERGVRVINSFDAQRMCGDKLLCSLALARLGVPTPRTLVAFSPQGAMAAIKELGYPVVMKPTMGSWARLVHKINDYEGAQAELESREEMGNAWQKIYYVQKHIDKPGRDIRAFVVGDDVVAAIYRVAKEGEWVTNTSRGGRAEKCEVTDELRELCLKAARAPGEGIYGVDMMEDADGKLLVHEINHTTEFRNSVAPTGVDIPGKMIEYMMRVAKR